MYSLKVLALVVCLDHWLQGDGIVCAQPLLRRFRIQVFDVCSDYLCCLYCSSVGITGDGNLGGYSPHVFFFRQVLFCPWFRSFFLLCFVLFR